MLGVIARLVLAIEVAPDTKAATLVCRSQPSLDVIRSSCTVTCGKVPVEVDLFPAFNVAVPNVTDDPCGTDNDKVPSSDAIVVALNGTEPFLFAVVEVAAGDGDAVGATSTVAAANMAPVPCVTVT
jgi:hypothetical protein